MEKIIVAERRFKTIYVDDEKTVALFKDEALKSNVFSEALHQTRVEEDGYCVSKIIDVCKIDGKWAIISEKVTGKILHDEMVEHPENMDEYLAILEKVTRRLNAIHDDRFRTMRDRIDSAVAKYDFSAVEKFHFYEYMSGFKRYDTVIHADLNPKNVLIGDDGKYYVLDWKYTAKGHINFDFAITYLELIIYFGEEVASKYFELVTPTDEDKEKFKAFLAPSALFIIQRGQFSNADNDKIKKFVSMY